MAAAQGSLEAVASLLRGKADPALQNKDGETAVHWCVAAGGRAAPLTAARGVPLTVPKHPLAGKAGPGDRGAPRGAESSDSEPLSLSSSLPCTSMDHSELFEAGSEGPGKGKEMCKEGRVLGMVTLRVTAG